MLRNTMFALAALGTLASSTPAALTIAAGTTVALTAVSTGPAEAATCKSSVRASGESAGAVAKFRKRRAERRARNAWEKNVKFNFGSRFADIDDAKNVRMSCDLNSRGNTRCTVTATSCG